MLIQFLLVSALQGFVVVKHLLFAWIRAITLLIFNCLDDDILFLFIRRILHDKTFRVILPRLHDKVFHCIWLWCLFLCIKNNKKRIKKKKILKGVCLKIYHPFWWIFWLNETMIQSLKGLKVKFLENTP